MYLFLWINMKSVSVGNFLYTLIDVFDIVSCPVLNAEHYVFACGKYIDKLEMLMYHAYFISESVLRRAYYYLLTVDEYFTAVGEIYSRNHIHQGRFSATVLTENCKNFSVHYGQIDIFVCNNTAECFGYVF